MDLAYGLEGSPASKITPVPPGARGMLRRGYTTQTDYRDSEAQTDPTTLGNEKVSVICSYLSQLQIENLNKITDAFTILLFRLCVRI